jgi:hypothetical protein
MVHPILQRAAEQSQAIYRKATADLQMEKDIERASATSIPVTTALRAA